MVATADLVANGQGLTVLCPGEEVDESTITIEFVFIDYSSPMTTRLIIF